MRGIGEGMSAADAHIEALYDIIDTPVDERAQRSGTWPAQLYEIDDTYPYKDNILERLGDLALDHGGPMYGRQETAIEMAPHMGDPIKES